MKNKSSKSLICFIIGILFLISSFSMIGEYDTDTIVFGFILSFILMSFEIYQFLYFNSKAFKQIKFNLQTYVQNCNDMNQHIEELKTTYSNVKKRDYGSAVLIDNSNYNYARKHQVNATKNEYIHDCSSTVCKNAEMQPFKYLCKYFDINLTEESLEKFENVLNDFSAVENGKFLLNRELETIKQNIQNDIPFLIKKYCMPKFMQKVGFHQVNFSDLYFPIYQFRYISPGGNKSTYCNIPLDVENLNKFVEYLAGLINFRNSVAGQRALMTSNLREKIKERDNYTCKNCNNSIYNEPNLLLEIDHIMPLSKGGMTTETNLQTLCWKCNRSKGAKIV